MSKKLIEKRYLSANGLLRVVRDRLKKTFTSSTEKSKKGDKITLVDCCLSALAMFKLKFPSLLQFDTQKQDDAINANIKNLFKVKRIPCDTYMRERLDPVEPKKLRPLFKDIFSELQRGKVLERYQFLERKYLLLSDGTGYFSSPKIHCKNCCVKNHKNGSVTYYHQFLGAVVAHPDLKEVIPICPEPIMKQDGATKNDCEKNATERLLRDFRREHPHLPIILVEDALAANGPHLKLLRQLDISFITVVKPDGNRSLFEWVNAFNWGQAGNRDGTQGECALTCSEGSLHKFRFVNRAPLNDEHAHFSVNFLEYWVTDKKGKTYHNTWITDIEINKENAYDIAKGGRTRWHIENETFNTLKNQGYNFEHNFGHGNENLSTVLAMLMMLAFLIDEAEKLCCSLFQGALKAQHFRKTYLWNTIRSFFSMYIIGSWKVLYEAIIKGNARNIPVLDSS